MVQAQGGDPRVADEPEAVLPSTRSSCPCSPTAAVMERIQAEEIGLASGALGAGRLHKGDPIDPAVGIVVRPKVGDRLDVGSPIGEVHARTEDAAAEAVTRTLAAIVMAEAPVEAPPLIHGWFDAREG